MSAQRIVLNEGIDALTAQIIAVDIGYTVGKIYQHFGNMDI